jgi:hypothetical protein
MQQQLIASLDRRYVTVRGIMMHAEGAANKRAAAWQFLQVCKQTVCPLGAPTLQRLLVMLRFR